MSARYETIARWVSDNNWKLGAELGVLAGETFLHLLQACPDLRMVGVDVWSEAWVEIGTKSNERCDCAHCNRTRSVRRSRTITDHYSHVMGRAAKTGRARLYAMPTTAAANHVLKDTLDFVFIDANHATEAVREDILTWVPKLTEKGWLIGHDWNMRSVRDAVLSQYDEGSVGQEDDHLWFVKNARSPSSPGSGETATVPITSSD